MIRGEWWITRSPTTSIPGCGTTSPILSCSPSSTRPPSSVCPSPARCWSRSPRQDRGPRLARGFVSRQPLGQHFLVTASALDRIARAACPDAEPPEREALVIEIGPGRGALTERLLARADRVVAIEIDAGLVELLRAKFHDEPRLTVVEADALET